MHDLSIVVPTCNRAALLQQCLGSIAVGTACDFQVIVVDGASTDRTPEVLQAARESMGERLSIIREEHREGFVRAANKGFAAATGRNLIWINDDARTMPWALDQAMMQLDSAPAKVGMVALFHRWKSSRSVAYETQRDDGIFRLLHVRGTLYANFGMARRHTFEELGYFDTGFFMNAADPDFSLKVWNSGRSVVPAYGALIDHDEHEDPRRAVDLARATADNERLFSKWELPPKNPMYNDFDPANPCTLRGLRSLGEHCREAA